MRGGTGSLMRLLVVLGVVLALVVGCSSTGGRSTDPAGGSTATATTAVGPTPTAARATPSPTPRVTPTPRATPTPAPTITRVTAPPGLVGGRTVPVADLPLEAIETLLLIEVGGPFPYRQDGSTFQNREEQLPGRPRGYYAEYTVETPGSFDRGARRIVTGDGGERYYTDDHYESFRFIVGEVR
ncbi:MAG: guanine-specific ribonuclease N1 and T1 [Chloroflexi bacterium]|nr:guanine-specific ribonuclease N1 and T1 [Chloroflexota bacterium]